MPCVYDHKFEEEIKILEADIRRRIEARIKKHADKFYKLGLTEFYIAGGALLEDEPNDYDLFPVYKDSFSKNEIEINKVLQTEQYKVFSTPNAITYNVDGIIIQLCKFHNDSLYQTVERFDFTHCKVGAMFRLNDIIDENKPVYRLTDIYVSKDFVRYKIIGYSEYTTLREEDFPLNSLLRVFKYYKRGFIRSSYDVVFKILESLLERGYKDKKDFFKQIIAIDVGDDEIYSVRNNMKSLKHLYYLITGDVLSFEEIRKIKEMIGEKKLENIV